ncbi:MAG: acetolactate synthase small subunit [Spirochaetaceae bacterium]|nr:acetolactate synthase small subunit [Spirochaetaceae bacterium]
MASNNGMDNGAIHTLSALVANKPGVLARIAQVFARRGFNIESLVVSPSKDGAYSRMTIGTTGAQGGLDQILAQVNKLVDVLHCYDHTFDNAVVRELALVKVAVGAEERTEALQIAQHFGCRTEDLTEESMIVMGTGATEKIDALISMLRKFTIVEMVRTGKVVMVRGEGST